MLYDHVVIADTAWALESPKGTWTHNGSPCSEEERTWIEATVSLLVQPGIEIVLMGEYGTSTLADPCRFYSEDAQDADVRTDVPGAHFATGTTDKHAGWMFDT